MINYTIHNLKTNLNRTNLAARSLMSSIKTAKSSNYLTITIPTASRINQYWVTTDLALIRSAHTRMLSPTERKKPQKTFPRHVLGKRFSLGQSTSTQIWISMKKMISTKFRLFLLTETNTESFHLALTFFEKTKKKQKKKTLKFLVKCLLPKSFNTII